MSEEANMAIMTKTPGGEEIVILSRAEYDKLIATAEDRADVATAKAVIGRMERGEEETLSSEEMDALLAAPTPLAFWRKKRGLTQAALSKEAEVSQGFLSEIEAGKKTGDITTLKRVAVALRVSLDDLAD
jgi:DNA-binding XRE family transcriptional regulator